MIRIFPKQPPKDIAFMVSRLDSSGLDLLRKILCVDPARRITARKALEHEYFKDIGFVPWLKVHLTLAGTHAHIPQISLSRKSVYPTGASI